MKKTLTARGKQVDVEDFDQLPGNEAELTTLAEIGSGKLLVATKGAPSKSLRAVSGDQTVEAVHTFGAVDGPRPPLTQAQVQKDLDDARQRIADEAAWREEMGALLGQVQ